MEFAAARRTMVDNQIRTYDVTNKAILSAFETVPREVFVMPEQHVVAYGDLPLTVTAGNAARVLLPPLVLARMLQEADLKASDKVLLVGSGTGYAAAIAASVGANVTLIERSEAMAAAARTALAAAGAEHVAVIAGDFSHGHDASEPYSLIVVEGAVETVPEALAGLLAEEGRLICVVGEGRSGRVTLFIRHDGGLSGKAVFDAAAAPLPEFRREPGFVF
jgi:protein-L-isoaspartate(D-aspartate) O-methyltransferase